MWCLFMRRYLYFHPVKGFAILCNQAEKQVQSMNNKCKVRNHIMSVFIIPLTSSRVLIHMYMYMFKHILNFSC